MFGDFRHMFLDHFVGVAEANSELDFSLDYRTDYLCVCQSLNLVVHLSLRLLRQPLAPEWDVDTMGNHGIRTPMEPWGFVVLARMIVNHPIEVSGICVSSPCISSSPSQVVFPFHSERRNASNGQRRNC